MQGLQPKDWIVLGIYFMVIFGIAGWVIRQKQETTSEYFLAGRHVGWFVMGAAIFASNIGSEHIVGLAGTAAKTGVAMGHYELHAWCILLLGWIFVPFYMRSKVYTMPEFLEYRYDTGTRAIMAVYLMLAYIIVLLAVVLYSGALAFNAIFNVPAIFIDKFSWEPDKAELWANLVGIWGIGIVAATYTIYGGLKSVVWSDLLQGGALVLGGAIVAFLGIRLIGDGNLIEGCRIFASENADKLHMYKPWDDPDVPWVAVFIGGLWIPNLFYWGLNQFIT